MANQDNLTHEEEQDYNKYKDINKYFGDRPAKVASYSPLAAEFADFLINMGLVPTTASGKSITTKGVTLTKSQLKRATAHDYGIFVPVSYAFCIKNNLNDEAANLRFTERKIFGIEDGSILETCTAINKVITDKLLPNPLFAAYGITSATLSNALAKAQTFDSAIGGAGNIDAGKKAVSIDLSGVFKKLHGNNEQFSFLMNNFKESDPNFYNGYIAVNVEHDNVRHTGIEGVVRDENGIGIRDAIITNTKNGRKVKTNLIGEFEHEPNQAGLTEFTCEAPGRKKETTIVTLKRGKMLDVNFQLLPQPGPATP